MKNRGFEAALFFGAVGALWRRWYGGGFGKAGLITRFWKYVVLIVICAIMFRIKYPYSTFWLDFRTYAVVSAFAFHWARSHGDYFFVYSTAPDEVFDELGGVDRRGDEFRFALCLRGR